MTLYLVFGGELTDVTKTDFLDPNDLHVVGVFDNYDRAEKEWRGNTQRTVDNAQMRYFITPVPSLGSSCKPV